MNKRSKNIQKNNQILTKEGIGFEWNVTSNYFNKNNCESDESDRVRIYIIMCNLNCISIRYYQGWTRY